MFRSWIAWIRKHKAMALIFIILIYLIAGAAAPFYHYKPVSQEIKDQILGHDFYQDTLSNDRAMILETNQSAWEERIRLMNLAKERIILSTFDFRDGESPRDLMALMLHKADQGVRIQILVDGFSGLVRMEPCKLFHALSSHPNVEIKLYNKINPLLPWKTQGRMHDKYVIVDDLGYILGGRNTFDYFIGSYPADSRSHDREVLVYNTVHGSGDRGSSLYQVEDYFESVWNLEVCALFHDNEALSDDPFVLEAARLLRERYQNLSATHSLLLGTGDEDRTTEYYESQTVPTGRITLVSNPTGIYAKEPVMFHTLVSLMKQAENEVIIHTPYAVFNDFMYDAMAEVTDRVPVEMLVNSVENGDNFFASSDYPLHKQAFLDAGIRMYEYDGGISYHGKSIVIDSDLCAVGSYNFDLRSTYLDTELMLVIQSPELTEQLKSYMDTYKEDCRVVLPDGSYQNPGHIEVAPVPLYKRIAWKIVGRLMQPFRFLI